MLFIHWNSKINEKGRLSYKPVIFSRNCNLKLESLNLSAISILLTAKFRERIVISRFNQSRRFASHPSVRMKEKLVGMWAWIIYLAWLVSKHQPYIFRVILNWLMIYYQARVLARTTNTDNLIKWQNDKIQRQRSNLSISIAIL